jgi:hypothetical protein
MSDTRDVAQRIRGIEALAHTDVGRNIGALTAVTAGSLYDAAHSIAQASKPNVAILTGAYVPWATPPAAETDGPPGAAILAAGFEAMGMPVRLVTDSWCLPVVSAAVRVAAPKLLVDSCDDSYELRNRLATDYQHAQITHLISIERLGRASDGRVRNFRCEDVTAFTAPLDELLTQGHWTTIAVGDGGNEIGMGNIPDEIVRAAIEGGGDVHCVTPCDHLIVSGVSNWGALALLVAVCLLKGAALREVVDSAGPGLHQRVVEACVGAGAVDGTSGERAPTVDGLDEAEHQKILAEMWRIGNGTA